MTVFSHSVNPSLANPEHNHPLQNALPSGKISHGLAVLPAINVKGKESSLFVRMPEQQLGNLFTDFFPENCVH